MIRKWILLFSVAYLTSGAFADVESKGTQAITKTGVEFKLPAISFEVFESNKINAFIKDAKDRWSGRNISSRDNLLGEDQMSPELKSVRDNIIGAKSADDIDNIIDKLESDYDSLPLDLRYFAAQFVSLKPFRGIVYRLTTLAKKEKITNSALIVAVQSIVERYTVHFTNAHSSAMLNYIIAPYTSKKGYVTSQFETASVFQNYLATEVYPSAAKSLARLQKLEIGKETVLWDNKVVYGTTSFVDGLNRYKILADVDRLATISSIHTGLASLSYACAYNLDGITSLIKDEGLLIGLDGFKLGKVDGANDFERVKLLKSDNFSSLFTLRDNGVAWTERALVHLRQGMNYIRIVWEETKNRPAHEYAMINSSKIIPWESNIEVNLTMAENLLREKTQIRSAITGETIIVDLPSFFTNPPKDLKSLLPTSFDLKNKMIDTKLKSKDTELNKISYRNYHYGQATDWNLISFKTVFPELKSGKDVKVATRIFSEAWNGNQVTILPFTN